VRTRVVFDARTSPHATIIEVIAKDEPGLLFRLSRALEEASLVITFSKINTEGTKVADVFYVQELDGRKVEGKTRLGDIRRRLIEKAR
jgi:[protein-PII] uridylyltransferase